MIDYRISRGRSDEKGSGDGAEVGAPEEGVGEDLYDIDITVSFLMLRALPFEYVVGGTGYFASM